MTSAGEITPPIAWAASWCTTPETGSYIDPVEEAARRDAALGELGLLVLRFAQILRHLAAEVLIDAHDLQLSTADIGSRLGDRRHGLPALAFELCRLALQGRDPRQGNKMLVVEALNPFDLAGDEVQVLGL